MKALKVISLVQTMNDLVTEINDDARRLEDRLKSAESLKDHYMNRANAADARVAELEKELEKAKGSEGAVVDPYHRETLTFTASGAVDTSALDEFLKGGRGSGTGKFFVVTGTPGKPTLDPVEASFIAPASGVVSGVTAIGINEGDTVSVKVTNNTDQAVKIDGVTLDIDTNEAKASFGGAAGGGKTETLRREAEAEMLRRAGFPADRKIPGRVVDPQFIRWATRNGGRVFRLRHPWYFLRRGTILVRDVDGEYFVSMSDEVMMSAGMVDHCTFDAATVENHPAIFEELFAPEDVVSSGGEGKQ